MSLFSFFFPLLSKSPPPGPPFVLDSILEWPYPTVLIASSISVTEIYASSASCCFFLAVSYLIIISLFVFSIQCYVPLCICLLTYTFYVRFKCFTSGLWSCHFPWELTQYQVHKLSDSRIQQQTNKFLSEQDW